MKRIGLTGGIGSGKSTIGQMFQILGVPVYVSDIRSKQLTQSDPVIIEGLKRIVSPDVYNADGTLNKRLMSEAVFGSEEKRLEINSLIHPRVYADFAKWAEEQQENGAPFAICESAILVESGGTRHMDAVIAVCAPLEQRIERIIERDRCSHEQASARIASQISDEERMRCATWTITTDDRHFVVPQIIEIYNSLTGRK
ncbi:MAG: dephospho-CoA kinase [Bacteroidales bacterium]|nr:dephospho-CoA kinase [Bacteroidales bacterium]